MSSSPFERFDDADVRDLIAEFPLAWLCPREDAATKSSVLPMLGEYDASGRLVSLFGHMSRANPLFGQLTADPEATFLFQGPQDYVSPDQAGLRNWGPTWNYALLRIAARIAFLPKETRESVDVLTARMEEGRAEPWRAEELGGRIEPMLARIIAFRAEVTHLEGKFKLAQDENPQVLRSILASTPDPAMRRWVERFNKDRL